MLNFKSETDKKLFDLEMQARNNSYDEETMMCRMYRGLNGYHSKLADCTVHGITDNFSYAYELLLRDGEGDRERAYDILYRVIPLQDINPVKRTYGIWAYYLEERLEEMDEPDWNMADFNAKKMLMMLSYCGEALTDDLKKLMKDSVYHACRAIIKRDVQPVYTNISIMGSYVTIMAGEMFGWEDILAYGKQRLKKLYYYNMKHGSFSEFNSPTYTFLALFDLSDLIADVKDENSKKMAYELSLLAWNTVAVHFHKATGQLAGPHYRAYGFLLEEGHKVSIERALDNKIRLVRDYNDFTVDNILSSSYSYNENLHCPEKYIPYFTENCGERILDQTFAPGLMAYTYMNDVYTVGSVHMEQLWNQHRNVLGYTGTVEEPIAFNLKCLHDGWDYCSGHSATVQKKGKLLNVIGFLTDAGDTHVTLDMVKNAAISAEDLRISWLFSGAVKYLELERCGECGFMITDTRTGLRFNIEIPYAVFGEEKAELTVERGENTLEIAALLYHGERKQIDFSRLSKAAVVTTLQILESGENAETTASSSIENGFIDAKFGEFEIIAPSAPEKRRPRMDSIRFYRDGKEYKPEY